MGDDRFAPGPGPAHDQVDQWDRGWREKADIGSRNGAATVADFAGAHSVWDGDDDDPYGYDLNGDPSALLDCSHLSDRTHPKEGPRRPKGAVNAARGY